MRLLFIGSDKQLFVEGTEAYRRVLSYTNLGEEIHIIVFSKKSAGLEEKKIAKNITLHPTNSHSKIGYIFDAIRIGKTLSSIDFVSAQDPFECSCVAYTLARFHKAVFQIQMHIDAFSSYFKAECFLNSVRSRMAKYFLPRAHCIRVVSERIKDSVLQQGMTLKCEPYVLPVYVDTSYVENTLPTVSLKEKYPSYSPLILSAGRLVPQKDIPTLLHAFKKVLSTLPEAGLVIVGEGPLKDSLKEMAQELSIKDSVMFEPWQKDMVSYYKTADIFIMTSTHEGYQRMLGEALAAGVPVVTTETGPVGSVYLNNDSVLACPVGDSRCLGEALVHLHKDTELKERLVRRGKEVVQTAIAPTYEAYLEEYKKSIEQCKK